LTGPQPSIGEYAAIGDCRSLALVSRGGSIDWFCAPVFSGASLFAWLLDAEHGGRFVLAPPAGAMQQPPVQAYEPGSNVLRTTFRGPHGVLEVTDFMAVPEAGSASGDHRPPQQIVRILRCTEGSVELHGLFDPRPGYGAEPVTWEQDGPQRWIGRSASVQLALGSTLPWSRHGPGLRTGVQLHAGDRHVAILQVPPPARSDPAALLPDAEDRLAATLGWWRGWCQRCHYDGPYADAVQRSSLALKLLTFRPSGAVVAAGTTSLPEGPGGRNWDYRYCWLRDTSLVLHAFIDLGYDAESDAFLRWLLHATRSTGDKLQVVYDVMGEPLLPEQVVPQLRGWRGMGPVRIGNAASAQVQHDIYGEVLLTACDHVRAGGSLDEREKQLLASFADKVCQLWREPDQGIWEIRLPPRHNTHSKLMCWTALDRSLWLQEHGGLPTDPARLARERDLVRAEIEAHGFDPAVGSYVGFYGSQAADASLLMLPRLGYLPADDPRMVGTVRHVFQQLSVDGLLYRYPPGGAYDGLPGEEHLFAICNFWAVDCLARQGRTAEALALYERLLALRNHVGLYAEEFAVADGSPIGNFPQAFSHVGLITAALSLAAAER
jgi:GH15 family glucan-1,4-alpha-glucosidase